MKGAREVRRKPLILILRLRNVLSMDATALQALENLFHKARRDGTTLILSGVHAQPLLAMERSALLDAVGEDNVFGNIDDALDRARLILGLPPIPRPLPFVPTVTREAREPLAKDDSRDQASSPKEMAA